MTTPISTLDQALAYLSAEAEAEASVRLDGDLAQLRIDVDGERYHSTVPGELARGIWDLQEAIYKAASFALTGSDDSRRLTAAQRQRLELVFTVSAGSTDLMASLESFFAALGEGFKTMDDGKKAKVLVTIAVIVAGYAWGDTLLEGYFAQQGKLLDAQTTQAAQTAETDRLKIVRDMIAHNPSVSRFDEAMETGARAIARGAQDASSLRIGPKQIDSAQIQYINQRAARVPSTSVTVTESFGVFQADAHSQESTKYLLGRRDGAEFAVTVMHEAFSADELEKLWTAARLRQRLELEVTITTNKDGILRNAQIISVL